MDTKSNSNAKVKAVSLPTLDIKNENSYWEYINASVISLLSEPVKNQNHSARLQSLLRHCDDFLRAFPTREKDISLLKKQLEKYQSAIPKDDPAKKQKALTPEDYSELVELKQEDVPSDGNCFFWAAARQLIQLLQADGQLINTFPARLKSFLIEDFSQSNVSLEMLFNMKTLHEALPHPIYGTMVTPLEFLFQKALRRAIADQLDNFRSNAVIITFANQISFMRDLLNTATAERRNSKGIDIIIGFLESIDKNIIPVAQDQLQDEKFASIEQRNDKLQEKINRVMAEKITSDAVYKAQWAQVLEALKTLISTDGYFVGNEALQLLSLLIPNIIVQVDLHNYSAETEATLTYVDGLAVANPAPAPILHLIKVPWAHYHSHGLNLNLHVDEKPEDENDLYSIIDRDNFILSPGDLTHWINAKPKLILALTAEDEKNIIEAKKQLDILETEIKQGHELYKAKAQPFPQRGIRRQTTVTLQDQAGKLRSATLPELKSRYEERENKALEYITFLRHKFAKLTAMRDGKRALSELCWLEKYANKNFGLHHTETLQINLALLLAQFADANYDSKACNEAAVKLEALVKQFEKKLTPNSQDKDIKQAIAMACYTLAQYYYSKGKAFKATVEKNIRRSEQLRKEYGASAIELDRIDYFNATIAYNNGELTKALPILQKCYKVRESIDRFNPNLIPVINILIPIADHLQDLLVKTKLLQKLLQIQKKHQISPLQIIATELKLIKCLEYKISKRECNSLIKSLEAKLNKIPITKENHAAGVAIMNLAEIKLRFASQKWSNTRAHDYYLSGLKLLMLAEGHLKTSLNQAALPKFVALKEKYQLAVKWFENPANVPSFIGQKMHPEDKAAIEAEAKAHQEKGSDSTSQRLKTLSTFSSEVDHTKISAENKILTIEDFEKLPAEGFINPYRLRAAQGGINPKFRDGKPVTQTRDALIADPDFYKNMPPVEIGIYKGKVFSFDTRRLMAHQQARESKPQIQIKYKKIDGEYLKGRIAAIYSPRAWNGLVTALRRDGKNSESTAYVNPGVRDQLADKVTKDFKPYPSNRVGADENGFPVASKKAKKIHAFLQTRNSVRTQQILKQGNRIFRESGKEAAISFFAGVKANFPKQENLPALPKPKPF